MAEMIVLRFNGVTQKEYEATNKVLGIDAYAGTGDWPDGMLLHSAGTDDGGHFTVVEVWTSRDAQASFMEGRLGAALQAGGVTSVPEITWIPLISYQPLGG